MNKQQIDELFNNYFSMSFPEILQRLRIPLQDWMNTNEDYQIGTLYYEPENHHRDIRVHIEAGGKNTENTSYSLYFNKNRFETFIQPILSGTVIKLHRLFATDRNGYIAIPELMINQTMQKRQSTTTK